MANLRLRPPREGDECAARAAQSALQADGFDFGLGSDEPWPHFLARLGRERLGRDLRPGRVPATFLYAEVDGEIVGRTSVRHALDDDLVRLGGHIGYAVLPSFRRRGYATEILRQSLVVACAAGVDRVLMTCDDDNLGAIAVIERWGADSTPTDPSPRRTPAATGSTDEFGASRRSSLHDSDNFTRRAVQRPRHTGRVVVGDATGA